MKHEHRGSLAGFFVLTYALMWTCFLSVALLPIPARSPQGAALLLLGAFAPSLAALWLTARAQGAAGVRTLVDAVFQWRVPVRWYVFAAGYMAAVKLAAAIVHRVGTGGWPRFGEEPLSLIPFAIAVSTPFQAGEEIGWRGYALPRLARRFGLAPASIVLGVIWAFWHLPQFFIQAADTYGQSFVVYILQVTAISVAMAFLYSRTGGSLLPVMVMHAAINNSKDIVPSAGPPGSGIWTLNASVVAWLTLGLLWVCAGWFLLRMRETRATGSAPETGGHGSSPGGGPPPP